MMSQNGAVNCLQKEVWEQDLCVGCGTCLGYCPYLRKYKGKVVLLDQCKLSEGECYKYCPRTHMDLDAISQKIFGVPYSLDEVGTVKDVFMARSTDSMIHQRGQDGGTITTLLTVAMEEGLIDAAVLTKMLDDKSAVGVLARNKEEIVQCAGNSYEVSFVLETFNQIPKESNEKLGMVGLPCQVQALSKLRVEPSQNRVNVENVKLVLGLFCGWALLPDEFHLFLRENVDLSQVVKFDIPHHPADTLDVYTTTGLKSFKIDEIRQFINPACSYCVDMTSEFADVSIGSGRRIFGWNTVLVRSKTGAELIDLAKGKGMLVTQPLPEASLSHLKAASLNKKKRALNEIIAKTGDKGNLLFLDLSEDMVEGILA